MKKFLVEYNLMNGRTEYWGERGANFDCHGLFPFTFDLARAEAAARSLIANEMIAAPARIVDAKTKEVVLTIGA